MTRKLDSVCCKSVWYKSFKYTVKNDGGSENSEIKEDVTHGDDVNEYVISGAADDIDINHLLSIKATGLNDGGEQNPESEAKFRTEFISLSLSASHTLAHRWLRGLQVAVSIYLLIVIWSFLHSFHSVKSFLPLLVSKYLGSLLSLFGDLALLLFDSLFLSLLLGGCHVFPFNFRSSLLFLNLLLLFLVGLLEFLGLSTLKVLSILLILLFLLFDFLSLFLFELLLLAQVLFFGLDCRVLLSLFLLSGNLHCLFDISIRGYFIRDLLALSRFGTRLLVLDRLSLGCFVVHLVKLKLLFLELVVDLLIPLLTNS